MKIRNISELKKSINQATLLIFIIIIVTALLAHIIYNKFLHNRQEYQLNKINSVGDIYKSNLSEKLSIIASSPIFIDYLHSGDVTRRYLYPQFLAQLSTLHVKSTVGMELLDKQHNVIFSYGKKTDSSVLLDLCYLNQSLNSEAGICEFGWKLYFDKMGLFGELKSLNKSLVPIDASLNYSFFENDHLGNFVVRDFSNLKFGISLSEESDDHFFYIYLMMIIATLILFSAWSWYRLSRIMNNYIANPIKDLAYSLKANSKIENNNNIEEIKMLIAEINTWKDRINKAQEDENAIRLGKIGAQLAHDIRSPLMVIDMVAKKIVMTEEYKKTFQQAIQRISGIASNFLAMYKQKAILPKPLLEKENVSSLLESIISEKRLQYSEDDVLINLDINKDALKLDCFINASDFKCVISNLINNSVEARCAGRLNINIHLYCIRKFITICIADNGKGIEPELLPSILEGVSVGKQGGTGLGLSHAKNKVSEWGGELRLSSIIDVGTKIEIFLPA